MTKIEIEGKCCHGDSNHELKVNTAIFVQMREEFETMNKSTDHLHVFPGTVRSELFLRLFAKMKKSSDPTLIRTSKPRDDNTCSPSFYYDP
jgi:hypothetical protein